MSDNPKGDTSFERRPHAESNRGRGGGSNRRGRGRRHTFSAGAQRKRFEELHYAAGGSKEDPLNLNGEAPANPVPYVPPEKVKKPVYSEPVEPFIPKNPRDPLGLNKVDKKRKQRDRDRSQSPAPDKQRRTSSPAPTAAAAAATDATADAKKQEDKAKEEELKAKRKQKKEHFQNKYCYGNFDRYYGTRLEPGQKDTRMTVLRREWFEKKAVLDIGCNVGFLTLQLAKEYQPRRILGIDIDEHLIGVARKNIRHYCDQETEYVGKFPASFCNQFGAISQMPTTFSTKFPDNVWFRKENYVLEREELVETVTAEFDVILALSITKWIHLNFGDDGMRRFFLRAFAQLLPGGRFILEPQPFSSYRKRAKMTETTKKNFEKIEFKPEDFEMYLIEVVGFERVEHYGVTEAKSKGFERPIDVYVKRPPKFLMKHTKKAHEAKDADEADVEADTTTTTSGAASVSQSSSQSGTEGEESEAGSTPNTV